MEQITYKQACEILNVKYVTIKDAVLYGKLTRCVYPEKQAMLLKAQVELFKGKRISVNALSLEDRQKWEEYKSVAMNKNALLSTWPPSVNISEEEQSNLDAAREAGRQAAATVLGGFIKQMNTTYQSMFKDANIDIPKGEVAYP
jgi:hypothetical protein